MKLRQLELSGSWKPGEIRELVQVLKPLPARWVEQNPCLKSIIRRSVLTDAPPEAPGHSKYEPSFAAIVVFDKGVYHGDEIDKEQFRRSIYHELAHSIVRSDPKLLARWQADTRGDGVVDEYARTGPEEDLADTFSEFFIHPAQTKNRVPRKTAFLKQLLEQARSKEKTAMAFIDGFMDEMTKTARGGLSRLLRRSVRKGTAPTKVRSAGKMSVGKSVLLGAGGTAGGMAVGSTRGKKKGYEAGTGDVMDVAQRARMVGRKEGVLAYHRALMQHRRQAQG